MLKTFARKSSAPALSAAGATSDMLQSCTIRFLDDSEPMSLHFKVAHRLNY